MQIKKALSSFVFSSVIFANIATAVTPGFYAGAGLGLSRLDTEERLLFNPTGWSSLQSSVERGGLGWQVFGGYNVNQYLGFELGYQAYAKSKYHYGALYPNTSGLFVARQDALTALSLVAKAHLPIGESGFSLYALGGGAQVYSRVDCQDSRGFGSCSGSSKQDKIRPKYGAGLSYAFSDQWAVNLEFTRIQGDHHSGPKALPNADALMLTLSYYFN